MAESCRSDQGQVLDAMIALTRPSNLDGVIIAGSESMEYYVSLKRRGYSRVRTPATCPVARGQHGVGLIAGHNLLAALAQVSPFLSVNSVIAVLIDSREGEFCMKIRQRLQQMGFRIEAGVRCRRGLVLSGWRQGLAQMERAA
jgi:hypothetical protein